MTYKKYTPTLYRRNKVSGPILGVDPGFDRVGVAIVDGQRGKEELLFSCCISTERDKPHAERLAFIAKSLRTVLKKYKPKTLAIEKLFFNKNITTAIRVAEARGVIIAECSALGLGVFEYSPQEVKMGITGYGKATKEEMAFLIQKLMRIESKSKKRLDDEFDAIAVAITHSLMV